MNTTLRLNYAPGFTLYVRLERQDGALYNATAAAFETPNGAHVADYALAATDPSGLGQYRATMPTGLAAGTYPFTVYRQAGGTPAAGDPVAGTGLMRWGGDGVGELDPGTGLALSAAEHARITADAQAALQNLYGGLVATGTVADASPAADAFVITLDGSQVLPDGPNFVGLSLCFTAGVLQVSKQAITGYQKIDGTHARLSFDTPFPGAPSSGDAFDIL